MKKTTIYISVFFTFCWVATANASFGTMNTLGGTTYFNSNNGSGTMNQLGGTTYFNFNNGTFGTLNTLGGTTYWSDNKGGSGTMNNLGGTTYLNSNDGTNGTLNTLGGTTYYHDNKGGSGTIQNIGGTTYFNFNNGPIGGGISKPQNTNDNPLIKPYTPPSFNAQYKPLPLPNVPTTIQQIPCMNGVIRNNSCITYTQDCQLSYGPNVSGVKDPGKNSLCTCDQGYEWNSAKTGCTKSVTCSNGVKKDGQCISYTDDCKASFGENVIGSKGDAAHNSFCACVAGYTWNSSRTACVPNVKQDSAARYNGSAPFDFSAQGISSTEIELQWSPSDSKITQHRICWSDQIPTNEKPEGDQCITVAAPPFVFSQLKPGTTYYFHIRNQQTNGAVSQGAAIAWANTKPQANVTSQKTGSISSKIKALNVRLTPDNKGKVLTIIKFGVKYPVILEKSGWYQIDLGENKLGWVMKNFTKSSP